MQTFSTAMEREFVKLANAEIEALVLQLTTSGGILTIEDYRRVVGKIEGLKLAMDLMADARTTVDKQ